ncbi:riboflavin kinase/FMN adenylyltransferase [Metamycoplasma subdolum]|uniref:FAD synthase n=1 Tax=Metamycoplasma subdolum TaxID=92407 RepID=A0A3M0A4W9_9BACT|nr:riboflavin biosynthesis protein [Metamycoplasma subdolum]RMA77515.1 riboflavin kinase/FMN adenylyltransferase [Metamycoplasma subdolum]WPB50707.1 riboflavin biosynthesis protein [Metamycoplasma subdolum]
MKLYRFNLKEKINQNDENLIMILGSFESLHLGHFSLIKKAKEIQNIEEDKNWKIALLMFKNPIRNGKMSDKKLLQLKVRAITLANLEIDYLYAIEDVEEIMKIDAEKFVEILEKNNVKKVVCGEDFRFGFSRKGDINLLKNYFETHIVELKKISENKISSTLINELILDGKIKEANELLIENYAIITNFDRLKFTFSESLNLPKKGIYLVNCVIKDYEFHGLSLIGLNENICYLFDLEFVISKHEEVYMEFLDSLRFIETKKDDGIFEEDIENAKKYFLQKK